MRKIINSTYITLDGAIENPQDWPSFKGGSGSNESFEIQAALLRECDTLLMGRRTYDSFAAVWPNMSGNEVADCINAMQKVVASRTLRNPTWKNTAVIGKDLVPEITRLKQQPGKHIVQYGLGEVSFALMQHGLIDEIRLWMHPLILGTRGPKAPHFLACPTTHLKLIDTRTLPGDTIILRYSVHPR